MRIWSSDAESWKKTFIFQGIWQKWKISPSKHTAWCCVFTHKASDCFFVLENQVKEYKSISAESAPTAAVFLPWSHWSTVSCGQLNLHRLHHYGEIPLLRLHSRLQGLHMIRLHHQITNTSRLRCTQVAFYTFAAWSQMQLCIYAADFNCIGFHLSEQVTWL